MACKLSRRLDWLSTEGFNGFVPDMVHVHPYLDPTICGKSGYVIDGSRPEPPNIKYLIGCRRIQYMAEKHHKLNFIIEKQIKT